MLLVKWLTKIFWLCGLLSIHFISAIFIKQGTMDDTKINKYRSLPLKSLQSSWGPDTHIWSNTIPIYAVYTSGKTFTNAGSYKIPITGWGRSPGIGKGNTQCSWVENSVENLGGTVHGVQKVRHDWATDTPHTHTLMIGLWNNWNRWKYKC